MDDPLKQQLALGRSHFEKKQYNDAERYLSQFVEQNQSFADVYNMLGLIYHERAQLARAQGSFEAALRLNPGYIEAALSLSVIYTEMGKYHEAKEVYQSASTQRQVVPGALDPFVAGKIANLYADIGDAFVQAGLGEKGVAEYRRALDLCPEYVDIRLKLGSTLRDTGQVEASLLEFERIILLNESFLPARVQYGIALFSLGKKAEAARAWEEVLQMSPGHKSAEMYLKLVKDGPTAEQVP